MLAAPPRQRPNIVTILVDDMGFSDIGCYGGEIPTPNIDRLASRGVRFSQFYNTARCSPSRSALLTGLYPHQAGMGHLDTMVVAGRPGYQGKLADNCVTIAEALRPAGYFTAMAGKWHLGQQHGTPPWQRGFDRSLNLVAGGVYYPGQRGREKELLYLNGNGLPMTAAEFGSEWYSTDLWTRYGLKFIDEAAANKKPFFLYLAPNAPHFPLMAPQKTIDSFRGKFMAGWDQLRRERHARQLRMGLLDKRWPLTERPPDSPAWDSLSAEQKQHFDHIMAIYAATVHHMDLAVGALVDGLRQTRLPGQHPAAVHVRQRRKRRIRTFRPAQWESSRQRGFRCLPRHELGYSCQHAVPALQALHSRGRCGRTVDRALAGWHPQSALRQVRTPARPPHRHHADCSRGGRDTDP